MRPVVHEAIAEDKGSWRVSSYPRYQARKKKVSSSGMEQY
jgi:hypothetical protein